MKLISREKLKEKLDRGDDFARASLQQYFLATTGSKPSLQFITLSKPLKSANIVQSCLK